MSIRPAQPDHFRDPSRDRLNFRDAITETSVLCPRDAGVGAAPWQAAGFDANTAASQL